MKQLSIRHAALRSMLLLCALSACGYSGKLTRRYKSVTTQEVQCAVTKYVAVHTSVPDKDPSASPSVKALHELSAEGQKALIRELSGKEKTSDELLSKLRSDLAVPSDKTPPSLLDFTKVNKRILTAIQKVPYREGERIEKIVISITSNDPNLVFRNCNRLITEYTNVDLGKLNYSASNSAELSGNLGSGMENTTASSEALTRKSSSASEDKTLGSDRTSNSGLTNKTTASAGINGKINASRSFSEEVQLRQRLVALNAFVSGNQLSLYQEGISGIDLTGNILSEVSLEYINNIRVDKVYTVGKLFSSAGAANPQAGLELRSALIKSPNIANDIIATIKFEAVYRQIDAGARTTSESDDNITLVHGSTMLPGCTGETFVLVPASSLRPNMWKLTYPSGAIRLPLHISNGLGQQGTLLFSSYENAADFLRWLKSGRQSGTIDLNRPFGGVYLLRQGNSATAPTIAQIDALDIELN